MWMCPSVRVLSVCNILVQDRRPSDEEGGARLIYRMLLVVLKSSTGGNVDGG